MDTDYLWNWRGKLEIIVCGFYSTPSTGLFVLLSVITFFRSLFWPSTTKYYNQYRPSSPPLTKCFPPFSSLWGRVWPGLLVIFIWLGNSGQNSECWLLDKIKTQNISVNYFAFSLWGCDDFKCIYGNPWKLSQASIGFTNGLKNENLEVGWLGWVRRY